MTAHADTAFRHEMHAARAHYRQGNLQQAFLHLERAHILGQRYFGQHMLTHWWMLRVGLQRRRGSEIRGQVLRLIATIPGYFFGWVPKGNTGGADVSPIQPMPIPADLAPYLQDYSVTKDVTRRLIYWTLAFAMTGIWLAYG